MSAVQVRSGAPKSADPVKAPHTPAWDGASPADRVLFVLQIASLLLLAGTVITRYWQDHIWLGYGLLVIAAVVWIPEVARRRYRLWWFGYVAGIFLYTLLRSHADDTAMPLHFTYPIEADRILFLGQQPVVFLQERLFDPTSLTLLDYAAVQLHWSFFIVPHALAVGLFVFDRDRFPRYVMAVLAAMWLGLVLFYVVPTAPPWMAAELGELGEAARVMDAVGGQLSSAAYDALDESLGGPNPVAAMPSIHLAVTAIVFFWARTYAPRLAWWLLGYTVAMGTALVYMAEHYTVDLIVGWFVAWGAWTLAGRLDRRRPSVSG